MKEGQSIQLLRALSDVFYIIVRRNQQFAIILEYRVVLATTKEIAPKIGLVRGMSKDKSVSFVEPRKNIKLGVQ